MLLAIDVGNTHTTIGLFQNRRLVADWRLRTDRRQTADELAASLHGLFELRQRSLADVRAAVVASVVPSFKLALDSFFEHYLGLHPLYVTAEPVGGMTVRTQFPAEVGADRIVNALAARHKYGFPAVIVDFGTAITFDCVNGDGDYIGGAILPGMALAVDALAARTAKLPRIDLGERPTTAIGTDTVSAIRAGILFGYGGMVEALLSRITAEMQPSSPAIVATGGMAQVIAPYAPSITTIDPHLTLDGLLLYHELCR